MRLAYLFRNYCFDQSYSVASKSGVKEKALQVLKQGADVNVKDNNDFTPLIWGIFNFFK